MLIFFDLISWSGWSAAFLIFFEKLIFFWNFDFFWHFFLTWSADLLISWSGWSADFLIFLKNWICWNFEFFLKSWFFWNFEFFLKFSEISKFYATLLPLPKYCQLIFQTNAWLAWAEVLSIDISDKYLIGPSQSSVIWFFR